MSSPKAVLAVGLAFVPSSSTEEEKKEIGDPEQLRKTVMAEVKRCKDAGFEIQPKMVNPDNWDSELKEIKETLESKKPVGVIIGFGLRGNADYSLHFEQLINTIVATSPGIKFGFNTRPNNMYDCVIRNFETDMVGVPGKSKGCATCRQRKIKCDQQKPSCGNCLRSNRHCLGYDKFPVFVNRTATGLQRRGHLEEVKPSSIGPTIISPALVSSPRSISDIRIPPPILSQRFNLRELDFVNWFHDNFTVAYNTMRAPRLLKTLLAIPNPGHLFLSSLNAISITHFGSVAHDDTILHEGQRSYVQALRHLQSALIRPKDNQVEDSLTCATVLGLHEVLHAEGPKRRTSWLKHVAGIQALLVHHGPQALQIPVVREIFEHCRVIIMQRGLVEGEASPFARPEWLYGPWSAGQARSSQQEMCDYGFRVTALIEQSKQLTIQNNVSVAALEAHLIEIQKLCQDMEDQHAGCTCQTAENIEMPSSAFPSSPTPISRTPETRNPDQALGDCAFSIAIQLACHKLFDDADRQMQKITGNTTVFSIDNNHQLNNSIDADEAGIKSRLTRDLVRLFTIIQMKNLDPGSITRLKWCLQQAIAISDEHEPIARRCQQLIDDLSSLPFPGRNMS